MKTKLFFLLALPLLLISFTFKTTVPGTAGYTPPVSNPFNDRFLFGAMDNYIALGNSNYDNIGFNLWHSYVDGE